MIQVFTPDVGDEEIEAVAEVIRSKWIGLGPKTKQFEDEFSEFIGCSHSIGVNSCTAALDLALRLLGIGPGDEVLVPTMTFVSTAHAVAYNGAKPIFVDCYPATLNMDIDDIARKINENTKAVIAVHYGGRPNDLDRMKAVLGDIPLIEDAAHAAGSVYKGKRCGSIGDIGCFSFHAVKNLSIGDGGCITTSIDAYAERAKKMRWLGIDKGTWDRTDDDRSYWWKYNVSEIGLKCHMNDIMAAMAIVQLKKLNGANDRRRQIKDMYMDGLSGVVELPVDDDEDFRSSWHIFHIKADKRNDLGVYLKDKGINTGVHYMPIHLYDCYGVDVKLPVAEMLMDRILSLPMHPCLSDDDVSLIINSIREFYGC